MPDGIELIKKELNIEVDLGKPSGGTKLPIDYNKDAHIINRPRINNVELIGDKTGKQLKLQDEMELITEQDIDEIMFGG